MQTQIHLLVERNKEQSVSVVGCWATPPRLAEIIVHINTSDRNWCKRLLNEPGEWHRPYPIGPEYKLTVAWVDI